MIFNVSGSGHNDNQTIADSHIVQVSTQLNNRKGKHEAKERALASSRSDGTSNAFNFMCLKARHKKAAHRSTASFFPQVS